MQQSNSPTSPPSDDAGRTPPELSGPLFLPVYEPENPYLSLSEMQEAFGVRAIMVNAFFLYRRKELRRILLERGIKDHLGFHGLVMTDSGAFQAFRSRVYLRNSRIIRFQEDIGADIVSPFDVVTPPWDNLMTAESKLRVTLRRMEEGLALVKRAALAGVQQGGRFLELRRRAAEDLVKLGVSYVALGSLVPFFTRNHNLDFVGQVIAQARPIVPQRTPIHLYGAGDPVELPFYVALGCNVFDSSSFLHYAEKGSYMTPYGAVANGEPLDARAYVCPCAYCREHGHRVRRDAGLLCRHNLWTVLATMDNVRRLLREGTLLPYLEHVMRVHARWFPSSLLAATWRRPEREG
jgi:7-cyano-7-deazaguanine tRNA-ribosyltransferase